jgi:hypothetical protein
VFTHQRLELADQGSVAPEREIRVNPVLESGQTRVRETRHLSLGERFGDEVRERLTVP